MALKFLTIIALACSVALVTDAVPAQLTRRDSLLPTLGGFMMNMSNSMMKKIGDAGYFANQTMKSMMNGLTNTMSDTINSIFRRDYPDIVEELQDIRDKTDHIYGEILEAATAARPFSSDVGRNLMDMLTNEMKAVKDSLNNGLEAAQRMASHMKARAIVSMDYETIQKQYAVQEIEFISQAKRFNRVLSRNGFTI